MSLKPFQEKEIEDAICAEIPPNKEFLEVRITDLDGTVTKEKVFEFCKTQTSMFLGGEEYAKNHHFHLVLVYDKLPKMTDFSQFLYDYFDVQKVYRKKKLMYPGNSSHSKKKVKNLPCYLCYVVKDGDYFSSGFSSEFVDLVFSHSHPKQHMTDQIAEACEEYQMDLISIQDLARRIISSRSINNCYNIRTVTEIVNSQELIRHPELVNQEVDKIKYLS